jgi:hypothetical protein
VNVKLSVHLVAGGKYWSAGEEVPDEIVPACARKWAVVERGNGGVDPNAEARAPAVRARRLAKKASQAMKRACPFL